MKNRVFYIAAAFLLAWTLAVPVMAESNLSLPYPARTFLYVVDCSTSMQNHQQALDAGRQMLMDLLPEELTTVVAFKGRPYTPTGTLSFGGDTSVLAGIQEADSVLEDLWAEDPSREITVVLFSDLYSSVEAVDGSARLTVAVSEQEQRKLDLIAQRWNGHVLDDKLRYYSLNWSYGESPRPQGYRMSFFVPSPQLDGTDSVQPIDPGDSSWKILKTCVEVGAHVMTGSTGGEWQTSDGTWTGSGLEVMLGERYRGFFYLNDKPDHVFNAAGEEQKCYDLSDDLSDGCLVKVEEGMKETFVFEGVSPDTTVMSFIIPQPKLKLTPSKEPMLLFEPATISVGVTDGRNYLGYDDNSGSCFLRITAPGKAVPETPPATYDSAQKVFTFPYTPEVLGTHTIELTYMISGPNPIVRKILFEKEVECPEPAPYNSLEYSALLRKFLDLSKGSAYSVNLSEHFEDPNLRLEFVVQEPEDPDIAVWDTTADEIGAVNIQACGVGSTILRYTVNQYLPGIDKPVGSKDFKMTISVQPSPFPVPYIIVAAVAVSAALAVVVIIIVRGRKRKIQ